MLGVHLVVDILTGGELPCELIPATLMYRPLTSEDRNTWRREGRITAFPK
jgi:hypothetical protein